MKLGYKFKISTRLHHMSTPRGQLHTSLYDERNGFNFRITNFPFLSSKIPHLRLPMAFLSHNSSDTPGLAPLMNVLF